jgi:cytochrome oxidase Cu insertion factor (SCO1/SenC/PrrC family)
MSQSANSMTVFRIRLALYILAGFAIGGVAALAVLPEARQRLFPALTVKSVGQALVGGPFSLTDHTGKRVTDQDYRGRILVVFFGFTFCPDVCPTGLQVMSAALDKLGPKADQITPVFISIDPERDTPEQMALYVKSFHPRLVGLTGTPEEIEAVAKSYRVYYKRVSDPKSTAGYTMDHSAIIYVMGRDGAFLTHFTYAVSADAMAERLSKLLQ